MCCIHPPADSRGRRAARGLAGGGGCRAYRAARCVLNIWFDFNFGSRHAAVFAYRTSGVGWGKGQRYCPTTENTYISVVDNIHFFFCVFASMDSDWPAYGN
jgi:hypothetical protein